MSGGARNSRAQPTFLEVAIFGDAVQRQSTIPALTLASAELRAVLRRLRGQFGPDTWIAADEDQLPDAALALLRDAGMLRAPLPVGHGGLGWGSEAAGGADLACALRLIGATSVSLGRVIEGHVNAVRLLHRCAEPAVFARAAADVREGSLLGLWVTSFNDPVRAIAEGDMIYLAGVKDVCSGAGLARHAVISALDAQGGENLAYVDAREVELLGERRPMMHGMRATATMAVRVDTRVPRAALFGSPGDYMREPDFSAGAWRTSAVTVGGLEALVGQVIAQLAARGRHRDPHQQARLGQMIIAREGAGLWLERAAALAEADEPDPGHTAAFVNLARLAIERACLEVIALVQRSLGLACLQVGNPVERLIRDLSTYLRQPAGDEVLAVGAAWFIDQADAREAS